MTSRLPEHLKKRHRRTLTSPPPDRQILSVIEAAALLGVGESTIRLAVRGNTIPHMRFGKRILFRREVIMKKMEEAG